MTATVQKTSSITGLFTADKKNMGKKLNEVENLKYKLITAGGHSHETAEAGSISFGGEE